MKNTPENRAAVNALIETARIRDTGYQIKVWDYDDDKQNKVMAVLRRREEVTAAAQAAEETEATVNE